MPVADAPAVASVARSHVGLVRPINEDRVFDAPAHRLWAVADGMGGHRGGDLAAQAVVDALRALVGGPTPIDAAAMIDAINAANAAIVARNIAGGEDAGSTVVAAHLADRIATIAWAGDSRAYLLRSGTLRQLTRDHSVVQEFVDAGLLTPAAAARHPRANIVTRALGVGPLVDLATTTIDLDPGDRLLLCSDGLSRSLAEPRVGPRLGLDDLASGLVAHALRVDGSDNISLVCIEVS